MGKAFADELDQIPDTMRWAAALPIESLRRSLRLHGDRGLLAIGSGGSFTAAAFAAELHERLFGHPSRALTPLECFGLSGGCAAVSAGLLLSAEGKNPDILAGARQLQERNVPAIGLTLRDSGPLVDLCARTGAAHLEVFAMPWGKDGYLATNSLLATMVLLWRAASGDQEFLLAFDGLMDWYREFCAWLSEQRRPNPGPNRILILHGLEGRIGAIDLESKFAEGALAFAQVCNFRQFAHGRHLQFYQGDGPTSVVALSRSDNPLAARTLQLLPAQTEILHVHLPDLPYAATELAAVMAAIHLTDFWAGQGRDPGRPVVPDFGRQLYGLDIGNLVAERLPVPVSLLRKFSRDQSETAEADALLAAGERYIERLGWARLHAIVCDFDGTCCDTARRFDGIDDSVASELRRLLDAGLHIAFATGRGARLAEVLRGKIPEARWGQVTVGCYSGSHIFPLDQLIAAPETDPRLLELWDWLVDCRVQSADASPCIDVGQLSLRGIRASEKLRVAAAISEWLAKEHCEGWRILSSGHSLDVLTDRAGKRLVVDHLCLSRALDPLTQVLRMGDAGDHGGNDYELLQSGLALSVDGVPPGLDQCWNLLPRGMTGARGTRHYLAGLDAANGQGRFTASFLDAARYDLKRGLGASQ